MVKKASLLLFVPFFSFTMFKTIHIRTAYICIPFSILVNHVSTFFPLHLPFLSSSLSDIDFTAELSLVLCATPLRFTAASAPKCEILLHCSRIQTGIVIKSLLSFHWSIFATVKKKQWGECLSQWSKSFFKGYGCQVGPASNCLIMYNNNIYFTVQYFSMCCAFCKSCQNFISHSSDFWGWILVKVYWRHRDGSHHQLDSMDAASV